MTHDVLIRGTKDGLLILLNEALDFATVLERLAAKLSASGRFFCGAKVTVVTGRRRLQEPERRDLSALLEQHGGLVVRDIREGDDPEELLGWTVARSVSQGSAVQSVQPPAVAAGNQTARVEPSPTIRELAPSVVHRTLRSGQSLQHHGDLIINGDVNPGAEVLASGHIIVLGALRGVAHAGATGDETAIVAAFRLEPTQLRIGSRVARPPDGGRTGPMVPEVARVVHGQIVIESREGLVG